MNETEKRIADYLRTAPRLDIRYLRMPMGKICVRKTERFLDHERAPTLELANLSLPERRKPLVRAWYVLELVAALESQTRATGRILFVELVHNTGLAGFFRRRGYEERLDGAGAPSFVKR